MAAIALARSTAFPLLLRESVFSVGRYGRNTNRNRMERHDAPNREALDRARKKPPNFVTGAVTNLVTIRRMERT
jgi:hypothetical protein